MFYGCAFLFEEPPLLFYHLAFAFTVETADAAVRADDTMARYVGRKGITFQCLSDSLCTATADPFAQFFIRDRCTPRHLQQCEVHSALKVRDVWGRLHHTAYVSLLWHRVVRENGAICVQSYK